MYMQYRNHFRYNTSDLFSAMTAIFSDENLPMNTMSLPDDIFTRIDEDFFSVVKLVAGDSLYKILQIQMINSARKLLNTADVFAFFQIESEETDAIKAESCFKSKSGHYIVKPGIQTGLSNLINLLQQRFKQDNFLSLNQKDEIEQNHITIELINRHPLLKSLMKWYQENDSENDKEKHEFLLSFIDNITCNLKRSSNRFRYSELVKKFAICLFILGGRQCYEFIRINLPGALPNIKTIGDLIKQSNMIITEGEFKFESVQELHSNFAFCSEDTTGVIRKVEYDSSTSSFTGFSTPLLDGIPVMQSYQADSFEDLKLIYDTHETAGLINVHMLQSLSTEDDPKTFPKPFLLSAYGTNNKFTSIDILRRWIYIFENCLKQGVRVIGFSTGRFYSFDPF